MVSALGILSVDKVVLSSVTRTLQSLGDQDGVEAIVELWLGPSGAESVHKKIQEWTKADIVQSNSASQDLHKSLSVLRQLTDSLFSLVSHLEYKSRAAKLHLGLKSLPNELLAYTIELACEPFSTDHVRFASINRHFRQVVLSHTTLWSFVSSRQSPKFVDLQLKYSAASGLVVNISPRGPTRLPCDHCSYRCSCIDVLGSLLEHSHRWHEVTLVDPHESESDLMIADMLKDAEFPALRRVTLGAECMRGGMYEVVPESWTMPALRNITCAPESVRIRGLPSIHSFHANLVWKGRRENNSLSTRVSALMKALSHVAMATLSSLEITFPIAFQYGALTGFSPVVHLPNLVALKLGRCDNPRFADYVVNYVLKRLDIPSLETIEFTLHNHWQGEEDLLLLNWFEGRQFEHLKKVHIDVYEEVMPLNALAPSMDFHERVRRAFIVSSSSNTCQSPNVTTKTVSNAMYGRPRGSWDDFGIDLYERNMIDMYMSDSEMEYESDYLAYTYKDEDVDDSDDGSHSGEDEDEDEDADADEDAEVEED